MSTVSFKGVLRKGLQNRLSRLLLSPPGSPEHSIFTNLFSELPPALVLYGPSKVGKTRIAAWEASLLAASAGKPLLYVATEANIEEGTINDILMACAFNDAICEVTRFDHLKPLFQFVEQLRKRKHSIAGVLPPFIVLDSVAGVAKLVKDELGYDVTASTGGTTSVLPRIYSPLEKVADIMRRVTTIQGGNLLLTTEAMYLRGESYVPHLQVKAKPRYIGPVAYEEDAEIYFADPTELKDIYRGDPCELFKRYKRSKTKPSDPTVAVVVKGRRTEKGRMAFYVLHRVGEKECKLSTKENNNKLVCKEVKPPSKEGYVIIREVKPPKTEATYLSIRYYPADKADLMSKEEKGNAEKVAVEATPIRPYILCQARKEEREGDEGEG